MTIRQIVSGVFIFQLVLGPMPFAFAAEDCGYPQKSAFYQCFSQSVVYLNICHEAASVPPWAGAREKMAQIKTDFDGGGCSRIADCIYITKVDDYRKSSSANPKKDVWQCAECDDPGFNLCKTEANVKCLFGKCPTSQAKKQALTPITIPPASGNGSVAGTPPPPATGGQKLTRKGGDNTHGTPEPLPNSREPGAGPVTTPYEKDAHITPTIPESQPNYTPTPAPPPAAPAAPPAVAAGGSDNSKWLFGIGGFLLGAAGGGLLGYYLGKQAGYNQYYQQMYGYPGQYPSWQQMSQPGAYGQVPGSYGSFGGPGYGYAVRPFPSFNPYTYRGPTGYAGGIAPTMLPQVGGSGLFPGSTYPGQMGYQGYGLGTSTNMMSAPVMLPPVYH